MEDASRTEGGYIKLSRKMVEWEWYDEPNTFRVFIHCLFMANWKDSRYHGVEVPRGSFLTGREKLAESLNMSVQSVRTALSHLTSTNEITIKTTSKGSIITVVKYNEYQTVNQQNNQQLTNDQPTANQQLTNDQPLKRIYKNNKNIKKGNIAPHGELMERNDEGLAEIEDLYLDEVRKETGACSTNG